MTLDEAIEPVRNVVEAGVALDKCRHVYGPEYEAALERAVQCETKLEGSLPAILSAMQQAAATIAEAKILIDRRDKEIAYRSDVAAQLQRDNEAKQLHIATQAAEIERLRTIVKPCGNCGQEIVWFFCGDGTHARNVGHGGKIHECTANTKGQAQ